MARIVKEQERAVKRNEILNAAQRLVYSKGYEQMSIQDILSDLKISKGAFYHYFGSKQALLDALIDRMVEEAEPIVLPIAREPRLPALEKLHRFFDTAARWKTARKGYILSLMRVWYADDNLLIRHKSLTRSIKRFAPLLADIIRQGVAEGVMTTPFPDQMGEVALSMLQGLGDGFVELIFSHSTDLARAEKWVAAYNDALERLLGAPTGSLNLVDKDTLKEWFVATPEN
jgi:AcrR family transcriptional regulator